MLRCLAIDDEPLALRQITSYIAKIPYLELVASCNNALDAQRIVSTEKIDLIFSDINMPDLSGVDFVRSLTGNRPMIIFTTAYSEYAVEGFRLDAVDYLLKPFSLADFSRAAAKAYNLFELRQSTLKRPTEEIGNAHTTTPAPAPEAPNTPQEPTATPQHEEQEEYLSVKADYKLLLIRIDEIRFIESEGEYVRIHLADGRKITTLYRLKNMEARLPADRFMRIHRSYIVNLAIIESYMRGRIFLNDGQELPIGDNYKEPFQQYVEKRYKNL
ncbi:MAG: LytTR family DNA-binding domain-containing protein [Rikenellaceae bacterium]|nr:LytTR family DNA-binding domain-containing protein [Rikenellaceae bacterium]